MNNLKLFCCCHFYNETIENLGLIPVGVGQNKSFPINWLRDNVGKNISNKNSKFGELTFHYWLWKNKLSDFNENDFIGFCQYRRFWLKKKHNNIVDKDNLFENLLKNIDDEMIRYDSIITKPEKINLKYKSVIKYRKIINNLKNPMPIFFKKKQTIDVQFEVYTRSGNLIYEVAEFLKKEDQVDFIKFIKNNNTINLHNMFITKKKIYNEYCSAMFDWLFKCDDYLNKTKKYKKLIPRMQAYLAERFLPFWFRKYTNFTEYPWVFIDTSKY